MTDWRRLVGREVSVTASGLLYRGKVVELGPHSLLLKTVTGVREIPWERITRVTESGGAPSAPPSALSSGKS